MNSLTTSLARSICSRLEALKKLSYLTSAVAIIISLGVATPSWADHEHGVCDWDNGLNLSGCIFVVEVEVVYVADALADALPPRGTKFENCYFFEADAAPEDKLISGAWLDPFYPAPGAAISGGWIQHTRGTTAGYTAIAADGAGGALMQDGEVTLAPGRRHMRLKAYSTLVGPGTFLAEFVSKGYAVAECPFALP